MRRRVKKVASKVNEKLPGLEGSKTKEAAKKAEKLAGELLLKIEKPEEYERIRRSKPIKISNKKAEKLLKKRHKKIKKDYELMGEKVPEIEELIEDKGLAGASQELKRLENEKGLPLTKEQKKQLKEQRKRLEKERKKAKIKFSGIGGSSFGLDFNDYTKYIVVIFLLALFFLIVGAIFH